MGFEDGGANESERFARELQENRLVRRKLNSPVGCLPGRASSLQPSPFRQLANANCPFSAGAAPLPKKSLQSKSFSGALFTNPIARLTLIRRASKACFDAVRDQKVEITPRRPGRTSTKKKTPCNRQGMKKGKQATRIKPRQHFCHASQCNMKLQDQSTRKLPICQPFRGNFI